jgi:hypothetical protein
MYLLFLLLFYLFYSAWKEVCLTSTHSPPLLLFFPSRQVDSTPSTIAGFFHSFICSSSRRTAISLFLLFLAEEACPTTPSLLHIFCLCLRYTHCALVDMLAHKQLLNWSPSFFLKTKIGCNF